MSKKRTPEKVSFLHGDVILVKFWLKPFSKGLAEPPRSAVALRRGRNPLSLESATKG